MDLILKGFIIGLGKIIPGVSGAMLAISLGIYEQILDNIANIKNKYKESIKYLVKPSVGIIIAIMLTSKIIVKCLNKYYFSTMLLFIGLIIGGMPYIIKQIKLRKKDIIISLVPLLIILMLTTSLYPSTKIEINYTIFDFIKIIGIGIIDAASSIIPGISGTAILMTLGYYDMILETFGTILDMSKIVENIFIIIPFGLGFIIGTIAISKIINRIIKTKKNIMFISITMFMTITIIQLIKTTLIVKQTILSYIIGISLLILGTYISFKLQKNNNQE